MKRKPWSIVILALLHVLAPIGNLLFNAFITGRSLNQQWYYWFHVLPGYLLFIYVGLPVLAGVFIYLCRRWSYWAYLACIFVVTLSNIYSYWTRMDVATLIALIVLLVIDILAVSYFVVPSVQKVYFDPRLRWWEAAPRYHFDIEGEVNGSKAHFKNLGQGGTFMTAGPDLQEGDRAHLRWEFEGQEVRVSGMVVFKNPHASGYGVRFDAPELETQRRIEAAVASLHRQGRIVSERLPGQEDSFGAWLKKIITTGEGLFPKAKG